MDTQRKGRLEVTSMLGVATQRRKDRTLLRYQCTPNGSRNQARPVYVMVNAQADALNCWTLPKGDVKVQGPESRQRKLTPEISTGHHHPTQPPPNQRAAFSFGGSLSLNRNVPPLA